MNPTGSITLASAAGTSAPLTLSGLFFATFVSEDLACIAAGILVAKGVLDFIPATLACFAGILVGDLGLYLAGRYLGKPAIQRAPLRWMLNPAKLNIAAAWYHRRGAAIILLSRFMPGSRLPAYFSAGVLHLPLGKFLGWFILAAGIWTPLLVGLSTLLGDVMESYYHTYGLYALPLLLGFLAIFWLLVHWLPPLLTWRGRRLAYSRWCRLTRWEFWPWWAIYAPVILWILYLSFGRYRQTPSIFTAVNPAIPHGGFVGESKSAILEGLSSAGDAIATWTQLPASLPTADRLRKLDSFLAENGLDYPVVLKPDFGERGDGVSIAQNADAAKGYLETAQTDTIAQAYIGGCEYGIFYYREPNEKTGRILGITDKRFTSVTGNGRDHLERLILSDARAVSMAPYFMEAHAEHLESIPEAGQVHTLAQLGTHSRGACFLDGTHLITPELESEIDRISQCYEGFYFGRYDIRCPSEADLMAGKALRVIELNGLTSEGTWMYDPKHSLWFAWRTLCHQWSLAYRIAAHNHAAGAEVTKPKDVWQMIGNFLTQR